MAAGNARFTRFSIRHLSAIKRELLNRQDFQAIVKPFLIPVKN